jgi:hypothetical protein
VRRSRTLAGIVATTALVVLATACGAGPTSTGPGGSSSGQGSVTATSANARLVAFARCMRSHGVSDFPDPGGSGALPKESAQQLGVSDSAYRTATRACAHLLPNGGNGPDQAQVQRAKTLGLQFARCMRQHGVALPDPGSTGRIPDPASLGIDQGSPQFEAANQACRRYRPPYMPSNSAYNAYARTHGS